MIEFVTSNALKGNPITLKGGVNFGRLNLNVNTYIKGPGRADYTITRDAQTGVFGLFKVTTDVEVRIEGLTLRNGSAPNGEGGGAILSFGKLTVANCELRENGAQYGMGGASYGGAIYGLAGSVAISASTLAGNGAQYGGAVAVTGILLTITDSRIALNTAQYGGGGVHARSNSWAILDHTEVVGNNALDGGGIRTSDTLLTLKGFSSLYDNQAAGKGGGVYVGGGSIQYAGVTIGDNLASVGDGVYPAAGATRSGPDNDPAKGVLWVNDKESQGP